MRTPTSSACALGAVVAVLALMFLTAAALAEVPQVNSYQGRLTDSGGDPVPDGDYTVSFALFGAESGGTAEWSCADQTVSVQNGLFVYPLGHNCSLPENIFAKDTALWLALELEGVEQTPRTRLTSTPYAYQALYADTARYTDAGTPGWTDDGTVVRLASAADSVGIGTSSPQAKLDVNGPISSSGTYQIDGNTVLTNTGNSNICVGAGAGENNTGTNCTFVGKRAAPNNQGSSNTAVGHLAGGGNGIGENNVFVGKDAGHNNDDGSRNTFLGKSAGYNNSSEHSNTYLGYAAGNTAHGDTNTYVGASAGGLSSGSRNVFIGFQAGYNEDGSDKLYIANSNTTSPLLYGDFAQGRIGLGTTSPGAILDVYNESGTAIKAEAGGLMPSAVYGLTSSTGGNGVYGRSEGSLGAGVRGYATASGAYGVRGSVAGDNAYAVYGYTDGNGSHAVYGEAEGPNGRALYGKVTDASAIAIEAVAVPGGLAAKLYGNLLMLSADDSTTVVELGEGLDYAEGFNVADEAIAEPGTVMSIDPEHPGQLAVSTEPYDKRVAGIVSGAEGLRSGVCLGSGKHDLDIALAGRVYCKVDATYGGIEPGDLLTTSSTPGWAMRVTDHTRAAGAVIGKAMEPLAEGSRGRILVLVSMQ